MIKGLKLHSFEEKDNTLNIYMSSNSEKYQIMFLDKFKMEISVKLNFNKVYKRFQYIVIYELLYNTSLRNDAFLAWFRYILLEDYK